MIDFRYLPANIQIAPHAHQSTVIPREGIKLPKIDVPTFDGNIMNWTSPRSRAHLSDAKKLLYLRHSVVWPNMSSRDCGEREASILR